MSDQFSSLPIYPDPKRKTRHVYLYVLLAVFAVVTLLVAVPTPPRQHVIDKVNEMIDDRVTDAIKSRLNYTQPDALNTTKAKYAFATLLADGVGKEDDYEQNNFFKGVRMLTYQLIHGEETRSPAGYPFIVIVNKYVSEEKRDRLRRDGAIIWQPPDVDWGWINRTEAREDWRSVMLKFRLWELDQFERICFMDGDMVLNSPLDDIFNDPAVQTNVTGTNEDEIKDDEFPLPSEYVFAGVSELQYEHHWPPETEEEDFYSYDYVNGGFFVMQPSKPLLDYYFSLLRTPDRFGPTYPEQNLWNYAHRKEGNMPWGHLHYKWNAHFPSVADKEGGVVTMHTHWWRPVHENLRPYLELVRGQMEGFFQARDLIFAELGL